jgi:hypothetical protein
MGARSGWPAIPSRGSSGRHDRRRGHPCPSAARGPKNPVLAAARCSATTPGVQHRGRRLHAGQRDDLDGDRCFRLPPDRPVGGLGRLRQFPWPNPRSAVLPGSWKSSGTALNGPGLECRGPPPNSARSRIRSSPGSTRYLQTLGPDSRREAVAGRSPGGSRAAERRWPRVGQW